VFWSSLYKLWAGLGVRSILLSLDNIYKIYRNGDYGRHERIRTADLYRVKVAL
jgi:hypothetical protein